MEETIKFKNLDDDEKAYWSLLFICKYFSICTDMTIEESLKMMEKDLKLILGCSFLLVTSNFYRSMLDLATKYCIRIDISKINLKEKSVRLEVDKMFLELKNYENDKTNSLKEKLCLKYNVSF